MALALGLIVPLVLMAVLVGVRWHTPGHGRTCVDCGSQLYVGFLTNPYRFTCEACGRVQPRPEFKPPVA